jgi:hypothetical protein
LGSINNRLRLFIERPGGGCGGGSRSAVRMPLDGDSPTAEQFANRLVACDPLEF